MKYLHWLFLAFIFCVTSVFSQENYTRYTVVKGEVVSEIAKKYDIKPAAIYELNPDAVNGIKRNSVLLIPTNAKKTKNSSSEIVLNLSQKTHEVLPKETVYGIAKQCNSSVAELYKINPELEKEGLKIGQTIRISQETFENLPSEKTSEKSIANLKNSLEKEIAKKEIPIFSNSTVKKECFTEGIVYEVLPKETLYAIAKQNGITVDDLKKANPIVETQSLMIGQKIIIPKKGETKSEGLLNKKEVKIENGLAEKKLVENTSNPTEYTHEILPKETKYGIAKKYGITVAELEKQNPNSKSKLIVGSVLKIRSSKEIESTAVKKEEVVEGKIEKKEIEKQDAISDIAMIHDAAFVDQLISTASENIGTPYRSGGTTKEGFDCSGLMCYAFSSYDIKLPRSSIEMALYGSKIDIGNAKKGDLIFFKTNGRHQINHVGMVVEVLDGEIKFIHSSNHGGVIISSTKESYYEKNLVQVNRVL